MKPEKDDNNDLAAYHGFLPQREIVLLEKFRQAEAEIGKNAADWNTTAKTKRSVTLQVDYQFTETRDLAGCEISSKTKLASARPFTVRQLYFDEPKQIFVEQDPAQISLLDKEEEQKAEVHK